MKTDFNSARLLDDLVLEFSTVSGFGRMRSRAAIPDGTIAEIAKTRGIPVSEDKVRRARLQLGVYAFPRGVPAGRGPELEAAPAVPEQKREARRLQSGIMSAWAIGDLVINLGRELYEKTGDNVWSPEEKRIYRPGTLCSDPRRPGDRPLFLDTTACGSFRKLR